MPYTNDIEGTQTPDSKQETNDMECPWLNRPNPIKPNAKVSKFEKGSSTFVCVDCGKRTRKTDTMTCNQAVELCASCYAENEADNQETDQAGRA